MIKLRIPSRLAGRIPAIGQVHAGHIQARSRTFADHVNERLGLEQLCNVIASANAPISHHDRGFSNVVTVIRQKAAHGRQQRSKLLVDRVSIQPVRHDNLDAAAPARL